MPSAAPHHDQTSSLTVPAGGLLAPPFIFEKYSERPIVFATFLVAQLRKTISFTAEDAEDAEKVLN
jgi:hypothetical protein